MEWLQVSLCLPCLLAVSYCLSGPMELLHVSHCYSLLLAYSHCPSQCHEVAASLSKLLIVVGFLSLFFTVPWSWYMSLTLSHDSCLSLTVSPSAKELLHYSHYLPWFQAIPYCLCRPMELLHVSHSLPWLLAVSHCLSQFLRFAACHLLSLICACYLSLSLRSHVVSICLSMSPMVAFSFLLSLWFHGVATCLSLFPIVACCLLLSLWSYWVAACLSLSLVAGCLSLSLPLPWSCCMSLTVSHSCWLSLTVSPFSWSC